MSNAIEKAQKEFDELNAKIDELNALMKEKSKVLMKEMFAAFFTKYENAVDNIHWTQYTPYFNDGEACEFSVHESFLTLKQDAEDEDFEDDGEGSFLYSEEHLDGAKKDLKKMMDWEKDPIAAAKQHQVEYMKRYNRDPFNKNDYYNRGKTELELMQQWKPTYYKSAAAVKEEINKIETFLKDYPKLKEDFDTVAKMISSIDDDLMKAMFGDHVKVIVTKDSIETEEYQHD